MKGHPVSRWDVEAHGEGEGLTRMKHGTPGSETRLMCTDLVDTTKSKSSDYGHRESRKRTLAQAMEPRHRDSDLQAQKTKEDEVAADNEISTNATIRKWAGHLGMGIRSATMLPPA